MNNFWEKLLKPIYALAPMAGVTDSAFRQMCKSFGADVVYSEMVSATALVYNPKKTLEMLASDKKESPYVIQLFGNKPEHFTKAVKLLSDKKTSQKFKITGYRIPDGIDINFGCPVKKIYKQGAGAALMDNPKLEREIIKAVIANTALPVSIKIRSFVKQTTALDFLKYLTDLDIKAMMIHGRALSSGHSGPIDYEMIKSCKKFFKGIILANGGIKNQQDSQKMLELTKADGIGIGQGALGRPWIFEEVKSQKLKVKKEKEELFKIILKHSKLVQKLKHRQGIVEMRKHLCWYIRCISNAKNLRQKLIKVEKLEDIEKILKK